MNKLAIAKMRVENSGDSNGRVQWNYKEGILNYLEIE